MVIVNQRDYKGRHHSKYQYDSLEAALNNLAKYGPDSDLFLLHKLWIEDEQGNTILNSKKTKREITKVYVDKYLPQL